jgi:hypothetical protein
VAQAFLPAGVDTLVGAGELRSLGQAEACLTRRYRMKSSACRETTLQSLTPWRHISAKSRSASLRRSAVCANLLRITPEQACRSRPNRVSSCMS